MKMSVPHTQNEEEKEEEKLDLEKEASIIIERFLAEGKNIAIAGISVCSEDEEEMKIWMDRIKLLEDPKVPWWNKIDSIELILDFLNGCLNFYEE